MGPGALAQVLRGLQLPSSPDLLIGLNPYDDAAVYRIDAQTALVQTVDFFPPVVDDPYTFGAIAAANALSDIYAMGARPILALAVAGFPDNLPPTVIQAILQGGADKVAEAGAVLAGGHTVIDQEPKYGLCVTGLIHPERALAKAQARPGDLLLLTKPLGTGVITTALKRGVVDAAHLEAAVASMLRLNRQASELAAAAQVHSATDITGYGLLGHASELARNSGMALRLYASSVPLLPGALDYAAAHIIPGGALRNRAYLEQDDYVTFEEAVEEPLRRLFYDPQTSGGLLLAVEPRGATVLRQQFEAIGQPCWEIGHVEDGNGISVVV